MTWTPRKTATFFFYTPSPPGRQVGPIVDSVQWPRGPRYAAQEVPGRRPRSSAESRALEAPRRRRLQPPRPLGGRRRPPAWVAAAALVTAPLIALQFGPAEGPMHLKDVLLS
ncbi:unnamed protein product [Prorocentrum cordatum]|uniref:Uncharacterized protein n=1 Tax=Prorocentrum cordatum TaxID=2364126 RepID=A0ABN9UIG4_9DINO|nr:unnamed protein product [Polarella glacialis]